MAEFWTCNECTSENPETAAACDFCESKRGANPAGRRHTEKLDANRPMYCIVGSWNDWKVTDMTWDSSRWLYLFQLRLGERATESFQIWLEGDKRRCLHPDVYDASPYQNYTMYGPDSYGYGRNWTIGKHICDPGKPGAWYEIRLVLSRTWTPLVVDWEPLPSSDNGQSDECACSNGDGNRKNSLMVSSPQPAFPCMDASSRSLHLYYMNVDTDFSTSSKHRRIIQEEFNRSVAKLKGVHLVTHRVGAVTPSSPAWQATAKEHGDLIMSGGKHDNFNGAAANCILLSFLAVLRQVQSDIRHDTSAPEFVIIAEDDMMLLSSFHEQIGAVMQELNVVPAVMGAMLHSASLAENEMCAPAGEGPALFDDWPRYPDTGDMMWNITVWPRKPVICNQPVVLLLRTVWLTQFIGMFLRRLQQRSWSPLDWTLANEPFGCTGTLRLVRRNGFCKRAVLGSDRCEQHGIKHGTGRKDWMAQRPAVTNSKVFGQSDSGAKHNLVRSNMRISSEYFRNRRWT